MLFAARVFREIFIKGSRSKMKNYPKLSELIKYGSTKLALNGL